MTITVARSVPLIDFSSLLVVFLFLFFWKDTIQISTKPSGSSTDLLKRTLSCEEDDDHKTHDNSDADGADSEEGKKE